MKAKGKKNILGFMLLLVFVAYLVNGNILWRFDNLLYDIQINFFTKPASKQIVIIGIDEKSLNTMGRWPWRRKIHAKLLDKLSKVDSKAIGIDIIFAEPDLITPNDDEMLAQAIKRNGRVVLPVIFEDSEQMLITTFPIPEFKNNALAYGHANVEIGLDGISRYVFLQAGIDGQMLPSMALVMFATEEPTILSALPGQKKSFPATTGENIFQGDYEAWLPFYSSSSAFEFFSYIDVLEGKIALEHFKDKYILIGLTAGGMRSNITTPISNNNSRLTGVNFMAANLDALIKHRLWQPLTEEWQLLLSSILILLTILIFSNTSSLKKTFLFFLLLFVAVLVFCFVLLRLTGYWFAPSALLLAMLISLPFWSWQYIEKIIYALFTEKRRSSITLNALGEGVITTNPEGIIDYLNPIARMMIGASEADIIGKQIDDEIRLHNFSNTNNLKPIILQCVRQHKKFEFAQCVFTNCLQKEYIVDLKISPLYDQKNVTIGSVLTLYDVKNIVKMTAKLVQNTKDQAQLTLKKEQAEHASKVKSDFLSHMSHELKTPLTAIIGYGQLLQFDLSEEPQDNDHLENVDAILKASFHLSDLISELLDLAAIESEKMNVEISDINIVSLIEECIRFTLPFAEKTGIKIINQLDQNSSHLVSADNKKTKQIILNFISNAIKYNRKEGEVRIYTELTDVDKLRICISDTGVGLTDEQQNQLFKSFERLDASKKNIEGTGIGLFISKQLAELMGGTVGVQSSVGKGSTFWVELKIHDQSSLSSSTIDDEK